MSTDEEKFLEWDDEDDVSVAPPPRLGGGSIVQEVMSSETDMNTYTPKSNGFGGVLSVSEDDQNPEDSDKLAVVQRDSDGVTTRTVIDFASPPLTEEEARVLTENIRSATNVLYILIKRAHAGKAWKALGYNSFQSYVKEEFQLSRSYAYKLLDQATVIEAIQAAAPAGTEVYVTESASRTLKGSLPELVSAVQERTEGLSPEEASSIVQEVIDAEQEQLNRKDDPFGMDDDDFSLDEPTYNDGPGGGQRGNGEYQGEYQGDYQGEGNNYQKNPYRDPSSDFDFADDEYYGEDDFAEDEEGETENDTAARIQKLERLYNFITSLRSLGEYAEDYNVEELFEILPSDREEDITRLLEIDIEWLTDVQQKWEQHLSTRPETSPLSFEDDEEDD